MATGKGRAMPMAGRVVRWGRGAILTSASEEARKTAQGRRMIQERVAALGKESVYNLTGLVRTFPLDPEDLPSLENQLTFYAHFLGRAEQLAVRLMGGDPAEHDAVMCNRVTSAMLAVMLGTLRWGDRVLSLVPKEGRSHPSIRQAVELVGGRFREVQGVDAYAEEISKGPWRMVTITPITPSKHHLPLEDVRRAIAAAREADALVFMDDAHMMSRCVFYEEPPSFKVGEVDVSVWSTDKHVPGPRGAAVAGRKGLMANISAKALQFGLEAQSGHYVAMLRGMEAFDPEPIRRAGVLAGELLARLRGRYGEVVRQAGPGVAVSAADFTEIVLGASGIGETPLSAAEVTTAACFLLFQRCGAVTIPLIGMPGASPDFRLMMHPDGARLGLARLGEAVEEAIGQAAELVRQPQNVRRLLLGDE